jgi:glycosyltransferase involved in cell wall biosynthesis
MARGEWVCFLDDDDFLVPAGIAQLIAAAPAHATVAVGDYFTFDAGTRTDISLQSLTFDGLLVRNWVPVGAYVMRRHAVTRDFDTRMRSHEDWDFLLSNLQGQTPPHVPVAVVGIDKTENMTTSTEARRRSLFWLDFLAVYARFPASHLSAHRAAMLSSLGLNMPGGLLDFNDQI